MNRCQQHRAGQISIDYMAGAMVFFGAVVILISSVMSAVPQVQNVRNTNDLQLVGLSVSEVIMNDPGYWQNGTANGTAWHTADPGSVTTIGLQEPGRTGLNTEKITALQQMNYSQIQRILATERDFSARFTEYLYIDTSHTFTQGNPPPYITEPAYSPGTASQLQYGSRVIDGTHYYFLLANTQGWYNQIWISTNWDFSSATHYDLAQTQLVTINENSYLINLGDAQTSNGKLVVLRKQLGRAGTVPPQHVEDIIELKRVAVTADDRNVIRGVFQVW